MKISFVIPIYNIEQYLEQCVNSIILQTYRNIEIILVDDGSTDNSGAICDSFQSKDQRIKVIHKKNGGLSDARNTGLSHVSGDYVIFVDGDDYWINPTSLETLVKKVYQYPDCDFIGFNCMYYYPKLNKYKKLVAYSDMLDNEVNKNFALSTLVESGTVPMSACLKIIKKKYLIDNNIGFIKNITAEDIPWFITLLDKSKKVLFVNYYIYAYRQSVENSITCSFSVKSFDNLFSIIENEISIITQRTFNKKGKEALFSFLAYEYSILLAHLKLLNKNDQNIRRKRLKQLSWLLNYTMNPKVKYIKIFYSIFGYWLTENLLYFYLNKLR